MNKKFLSLAALILMFAVPALNGCARQGMNDSMDKSMDTMSEEKMDTGKGSMQENEMQKPMQKMQDSDMEKPMEKTMK
jgi:hypothetical protein